MFKFNVGTKIRVTETDTLIAKSVKVFYASFTFSDIWKGLDKQIYFKAGDVKMSILLDEHGCCEIPWEVLDIPRKEVIVGAVGFNEEGVVLPAIEASCGYTKTGSEISDEEEFSKEPTKEFVEELFEAANAAEEVALSLRADADAGKFDGYTPVKGVDYRDGIDGKDGYTPIKGVDYVDGYTPVKGVDYFDGYTPIKGVDYRDGIDGQDGKDGAPGKDGKDGYTPVKGVDYFDGADGAPGRDGIDGYTPVKGVDYFDGQDGRDGVDGAPGKDGKDGYTPVKGVDYFDGQDGAPGEMGPKGDPGYSPVKGTDYWTESDKQEIVSETTEEVLQQVNSVNFYICNETEVDADGKPTVTDPDESTFYLVSSGETAPNLFIEWVWVDGAWEKFGSATIDLTDYVKNTDYATPSGTPGLVTSGAGLYVSSGGKGELRTQLASNGQIDAKTSAFNIICPYNLDYAVKKALADSVLQGEVENAWTDEEKAAARSLLGAVGSEDHATYSKAGVVKIGSGLRYDPNAKVITTSPASQTSITNKTDTYGVITPTNHDFAVKVALTTNTNVLTTEEQAAAQSWLGLDSMVPNIITYDDIYHIGAVIHSIDLNFNPNVEFGGTWELVASGVTLRQASEMYPLGTIYGEAEHTLTADELPVVSTSGIPAYSDTNDTLVLSTATGQADEVGYGGSQPHNNIGPSMAVNIWRKTAGGGKILGNTILDAEWKGLQGPKGEPGETGYTPVKGTDYWTEADKSEIVSDVLEQTVISYDQIYHIGAVIHSLDLDFDPNVTYGGTWELIGSGLTLRQASELYPLGTVYGEAEHTLTVEEMPSHTHTVNMSPWNSGNMGSGSDSWFSQDMLQRRHSEISSATGGSQPHNNIGPSMAVNIWRKTANGNKIITPLPEEQIESYINAVVMEKMWPVGRSFTWAPVEGNSTDLSTAEKVHDYFGFGTWQQVKDTFLLAAGDTYTAGETGGEAEHTLTVDEMPKHKHSLAYSGGGSQYDWGYNYTSGSGGWEGDSGVQNTGGSQPHNNMPPYKVVYVWQRIS